VRGPYCQKTKRVCISSSNRRAVKNKNPIPFEEMGYELISKSYGLTSLSSHPLTLLCNGTLQSLVK